ncbi:cytochrome b/b6 domain-containing protein [Ruegeria aquimaris]|uniref:Cytochrome b/b6 domain-containing protein n=1 Tax=Ruegeria aquimaris TaxID=2984333 RepID=A0ABT3AEG4_9RHOB|nr:cytochrome b/b6 domain-containing protein [Ruegeria sp. XHP0148]MCV2887015.1 cytochrome b/b6 domain-containing protein [Ruegeria sp. XHP0148]
MQISNTDRSYGGVTKSFHWLTALLILTIIPVGWIANDLAHAVTDPSIPSTEADIARAAWLFSVHKTLGVTMFFVAVARILWALTQTKPGLLNAENRAEAMAAETVHWLLYGSLVLVPLSGWIHHAATEGFAPIWWPFGQSLPLVPKDAALAALAAGLHQVLQWVLVGSLALHVAGALKHHVIDRDQTLRRMLPGRGASPLPPAQTNSGLPLVAALAVWVAALGTGTWLGMFDRQAGAVVAQGVPLESVASDWTVSEGTLSITVTQLGNPVTGSFADWTAAIHFEEPQQPGPAGDVAVTIAIGSLTLGSVTAQAMGPDFFDASVFPTAEFLADLYRTEAGYEARGTLTLRGTTVDVTLPFDLDQQGNTARASGTVTLNRLDFGIGGNMADESSLKFPVTVTMSLTATK